MSAPFSAYLFLPGGFSATYYVTVHRKSRQYAYWTTHSRTLSPVSQPKRNALNRKHASKHSENERKRSEEEERRSERLSPPIANLVIDERDRDVKLLSFGGDEDAEPEPTTFKKKPIVRPDRECSRSR